MKPDLAKLVTRVEQLLQAENSTPQVVIDVLVVISGARVRYVSGTYELRFGGVTGTATSGADGALIESWLRCARRKVERSAAK